jgi:hypothetical protein
MIIIIVIIIIIPGIVTISLFRFVLNHFCFCFRLVRCATRDRSDSNNNTTQPIQPKTTSTVLQAAEQIKCVSECV